MKPDPKLDPRVRYVHGRWHYVHPAFTITDHLSGRLIHSEPEYLERADSYPEAVKRADYYEETERASRQPGASEGFPQEPSFDGDW